MSKALGQSASTSSAALLSDLIAFNTISALSNLEMMSYVQEYLRALGYSVDLLPNPRGSHANLLATIGPVDQSGLILSGHSDVVPVEGQDWQSDPFEAVGRNGRIYGRGSTDMKGFVACVLSAAGRWSNRALSRPIHIALSYDEEIGCRGVPDLIDHIKTAVTAPPIGCVVGEPTQLCLVDGHKGKVGMRCAIRGREGHSAMTHHGANAVIAAGEIIAFIASMGRELARIGPFSDGYEPTYTTTNVGRIEGGSQLNIIPNSCSFEFEVRALPSESASSHAERVVTFAKEVVLPRMRETASESNISFETIIDYPGFQADPNHPWYSTMVGLTQTSKPEKVSYGTEAGHFAKHGIPVVVCGPGDMAVAHRPDESIEVSQLDACDRFLDSLMAEVAA